MSGPNPQPDALTKAVADILSVRYEYLKAEHGATQRKIGKAAGISQGQMSRILSGERGAHIEHYNALCSALGLNLVEVFDKAQEMVRWGAVHDVQPVQDEQPLDIGAPTRPVHARSQSRASGATSTRRRHTK